MAKLGGRMTLRFSTGQMFSLRSGMTLMTAGQSNELITNQDGSNSVVGTPTARRAEITFEDKGVDLEALMLSDPFNATFIEEFTGVTHYFTSTTMIGEPSINRGNGEVTGLTIAAEGYSRTGG